MFEREAKAMEQRGMKPETVNMLFREMALALTTVVDEREERARAGGAKS